MIIYVFLELLTSAHFLNCRYHIKRIRSVVSENNLDIKDLLVPQRQTDNNLILVDKEQISLRGAHHVLGYSRFQTLLRFTGTGECRATLTETLKSHTRRYPVRSRNGISYVGTLEIYNMILLHQGYNPVMLLW